MESGVEGHRSKQASRNTRDKGSLGAERGPHRAKPSKRPALSRNWSIPGRVRSWLDQAGIKPRLSLKAISVSRGVLRNRAGGSGKCQ